MTISSQIKRKRRSIYPKLSKDQQIRCILGDASGRITVTGTQYVWARENIGTNSDGSTRYGEAFQVLPAGGIAIPNLVGQPVLVGLSIGGELQITGNDVETVIDRGGKPRLLNPYDPYNKFVYMRNADLAMVYSTGTDNTDSLSLFVKPLVYINNDGILQAIEDKTEIDMTSYVPSTTDKKVLALIFLDTINNTIEVQVSDEIPIDSSFQISDANTAVQLASPLTMLLSGWTLYEGMTTIREQDFLFDGRQWIDVPLRTPNYPTKTRTTASSYTVLAADNVIFANTDSNAVTINLLAGVDTHTLRIVNTGTSGNNVTITPNGAEHLIGVNSSFTLFDGEALEVTFDDNDGWY
jgi:hypothetical protein